MALDKDAGRPFNPRQRYGPPRRLQAREMDVPKRMLPLIGPLALSFAFTASAPGQELGDAEQGRTLVRQWCTSCHVVEHGGTGADVGPALPMLLENDLRTPDQIRGWLANPHPAMPDFDLTRQEIEDVVAYLEELRDQKPE